MESLTTRVFRLKIPVPKEVDVMNFSLTDDDRKKLFAAGTDAAKAFLELESVRPLSVQAGSLIQYVQAQHAPERLVVPLLRDFCREAERDLGVTEPRACIFMAISENERRIVYHTFSEDDPEIDPDKPFNLKLGEGVIGAAWETRRFAFGILPGQGIDIEKAKNVRKDRKSAFCVPLFRVEVSGQHDLLNRPLLGVLALDSSKTIADLKWHEDATDMMRLGKRWADTFAKLLY